MNGLSKFLFFSMRPSKSYKPGLVLGLKKSLLECATLRVKSEVMLMKDKH